MDAKHQYLYNALGAGWYEQLKHLFDEYEFNRIIDLVRSERQLETIYPESKDLFRNFYECPWERLKVVFINSFPKAVNEGLAFNNDLTAWKHFEFELNSDVQFGRYLEMYGNLDYWSHSGILLLNEVFTTNVREQLLSSSVYWKWFTLKVIKTIATKKQNVVFVVFDNDIYQKVKNVIETNNSSCYCMFLNNVIIGTKMFSRINNFLKGRSIEEIYW